MTSAAKQHTLDLAERYVCPDRVRVMSGAGIDLVMDPATIDQLDVVVGGAA